MTRTGSLAYYLAAWVCGCTFMGILFWVPTLFAGPVRSSAELLFFIIGFSLMCGAVSAIIFAFILRLIAEGLGLSRSWNWAILGAIVAPALVETLGMISSSGLFVGNRWRAFFFLVLEGPQLIHAANSRAPFLAAPAGAATAWVLFCVQRAFAPHTELRQTGQESNLGP